MTTDREEKIRERAYAIWFDQGCVDGLHQEQWLEAEKEIDKEEAAEAAQQSAVKSSANKPGLLATDLNASNDK